MLFSVIGAVTRPYKTGIMILSFPEAARKGIYGKQIASMLKDQVVDATLQGAEPLLQRARALLAVSPHLQPLVM